MQQRRSNGEVDHVFGVKMRYQLKAGNPTVKGLQSVRVGAEVTIGQRLNRLFGVPNTNFAGFTPALHPRLFS